MARYVKPTLDTKFHIDFAWWEKQENKFKVQLRSQACPECLINYDDAESQMFDWVDSETGEVFQIDLLWHLIYKHCGQNPDFIEESMALTTAIFRAFIANNNAPLTTDEIHKIVKQKSPSLILRTVGGHTVYQGIRPVTQSA
jgi:hypothetical protein